ncbi:MAG: sulfite exporter TauE/SafE family protein [Telmatospirillum sp.]|nr:sulfite exporter TauE/SafE family protein [Telmatospirillum sp.]
MIEPFLLASIAAAFVLAGFVKGVVGLGLPTIAMGLMSLALLPAQAAAILIVPSLVTNIWQLWAGPDFRGLVRRLWPMLASVCVGVWLGSGWLAGEQAGAARVALGIALVVYAGLALANIRLPSPGRHEALAAPIVGILTGLVTAATGIFTIPAVPYLQSLGLDKEDMIQALGLSFLVATVALGFSLAGGNVYDLDLLLGSYLAVLPALGGMALGTKLRHRMPAATFRRWFLIGLLALGAYLAARGLV